MQKLITRLLRDDTGATAIEYGLIAALISVALIAGATSLGDQIGITFNTLNTKMDTANG